jgi:hypothetical protein
MLHTLKQKRGCGIGLDTQSSMQIGANVFLPAEERFGGVFLEREYDWHKVGHRNSQGKYSHQLLKIVVLGCFYNYSSFILFFASSIRIRRLPCRSNSSLLNLLVFIIFLRVSKACSLCYSLRMNQVRKQYKCMFLSSPKRCPQIS